MISETKAGLILPHSGITAFRLEWKPPVPHNDNSSTVGPLFPNSSVFRMCPTIRIDLNRSFHVYGWQVSALSKREK